MKMHSKNYDYYEIENYWLNKKKYCMAFFNKAAKNGKLAVFAKYGQEEGNRILELVKKEYENLLPTVPYVGEIDIMQRQMLLTVIFAAIYRVLKEKEKIGDIWNLCNDFNKTFIMNLPKIVRWLIKQSTFSKKFKNDFKKNAKEQKEKNLADQWEYVEGDGKTFDYGTNITKCAKLIFLQKLGYEEFLPYCCLVDKNFAECCNYGFKRTKTLAEGAEYCDFRISKNGPVEVKTSVKL